MATGGQYIRECQELPESEWTCPKQPVLMFLERTCVFLIVFIVFRHFLPEIKKNMKIMARLGMARNGSEWLGTAHNIPAFFVPKTKVFLQI